MLVRCKSCNLELSSHPVKTVSCGCPNMTTLRGDVITANDLGQVVIVESNKENKKPEALSREDILWQENRRKRKVRRLDFEVR
jgi:hypothetical protein